MQENVEISHIFLKCDWVRRGQWLHIGKKRIEIV